MEVNAAFILLLTRTLWVRYAENVILVYMVMSAAGVLPIHVSAAVHGQHTQGEGSIAGGPVWGESESLAELNIP